MVGAAKQLLVGGKCGELFPEIGKARILEAGALRGLHIDEENPLVPQEEENGIGRRVVTDGEPEDGILSRFSRVELGVLRKLKGFALASRQRLQALDRLAALGQFRGDDALKQFSPRGIIGEWLPVRLRLEL